nr:fasciclin domain-containing protein [Candidatus Bathyarchaeota archaeon]
GVLDDLLANVTALTEVLTYHVVSGEYMAADVVTLSALTTVQGGNLTISATDGVQIDGANVVQTDIACRNGVIHVIDAVLIP